MDEKPGAELPVQLTVERHFKHGKGPWVPGSTDTAPIRITTFRSAPATVGVEAGLTLNLGNFESAKVAVSLSMPCYPEEVEDAYEWVRDFVEKKLQVEVEDIRKSTKHAGSGSPF